MSRKKKLPKPRPDLQRPLLDLIPTTWTTEQAIAVYDFCSILQELVWRRYENVLIDAALQAQQPANPAKGADERTHHLPFDDDSLF